MQLLHDGQDDSVLPHGHAPGKRTPPVVAGAPFFLSTGVGGILASVSLRKTNPLRHRDVQGKSSKASTLKLPTVCPI